MELKRHKLTIGMIIAFLIITGLWIGSAGFIFCNIGYPNTAGEAGDLFGAIGALFSGWAFCGILWAILLQRKSLQIQHDDLMASLEEMKQSREAHEESAEALNRQIEATNINSKVDILKTLIETILTCRGNGKLDKHFQKLQQEDENFRQYITDIEEIYEELRHSDNRSGDW